ncbi:MAG: prepilin-type N-terminal cleavage/methylation domain-containing protein [Candidatus Omnitrophica bacterium]|nr:prepilin-type N-terminal cleavage/methylation domain-containing protein [Candidatus Omnitrophota bacterium]
MKNYIGFTLVEVIVAMVVFALVVVGLTSVFISGGKLIMHNRERMTSGQLGKLFIDSLQKDVRQDTWASGAASNGLTLGTTYCDDDVGHALLQNINCPAASGRNINNRVFSATYVTVDGATDAALTGTDLRRVVTTITWTEPSS